MDPNKAKSTQRYQKHQRSKRDDHMTRFPEETTNSQLEQWEASKTLKVDASSSSSWCSVVVGWLQW
jgi:hypothetical protein